MNIITIALAIYSTLLTIGGLIGFLKVGSLVSLLMGVGSGLVLGYCTWAYYAGKGLHCMVVTGLTTAITLFFAYRFYETHKIFPPAIMALAGLVVLAILFLNRPAKC